MKHITVTYLFAQFFYRIRAFLRNWYIKSVRIYADVVIGILEYLDRFFAWKITAKNLFKPLFKDYSFFGYILGFVFRVLRLLVAGAVYAVLLVAAIFLGALWVLFIPYVIYRIFAPLW